MSTLTSYFENDFNSLQDQWEKTLIRELKLTEIGKKGAKAQLLGPEWPTLSLETKSEVQLSSSSWKKAATTYVQLLEDTIHSGISEDLESGVRNFFFHKDSLNQKKWHLVESVLKNHPDIKDIEVFFLGGAYESKDVKTISNLISGEEFHHQGSHSTQELGLLAKNLITNLDKLDSDIYLGVYVDSNFFHNIAKLRAAKLLALKILSEEKKSNKVKVVALTSYTGWTLFERYSNMLRNETAVASAYIGGADHIQSSGYNTLMELEAEGKESSEHSERSQRMARNTSHVLALESMLGLVEDAAFGSYHLENLTESLCENSWKTMQELLSGKDLSEEIALVRDKRLKMVKTRKHVLSGTNDFPDAKEHLNIKLKDPSFFRVARPFEELRLQMEEVRNKPEVYIALYGDYSTLNARVNFVKNYFELLGLTVHEPAHSETDFKKKLSDRSEQIVVLCSLDEHYPELREAVSSIKTPHKFIAGKFELAGFTNLYAGQDIYEVLKKIVESFKGSKS